MFIVCLIISIAGVSLSLVSCISACFHSCCLDTPSSLWLNSGSYIWKCFCRNNLRSSIKSCSSWIIFIEASHYVLVSVGSICPLSEFSLWTLGLTNLSSKHPLLKEIIHCFFLEMNMLNLYINSKWHLTILSPRVW